MKTKDGYEYRDGMTLYGECLGEVRVLPTKRLDPHCTSGEYADGDPRLSVHIPAHYAKKENAWIEATNHWLKILEQARQKLAALNKERLADIGIGPAATVSAPAANPTTTIPQTPIN